MRATVFSGHRGQDFGPAKVKCDRTNTEGMFSVEADDINRLIKINWSENVSADEMRECAEQLGALTADIRPGFEYSLT